MTNHGINAPWPEPQVETLKALWAEGKSASEIAKVLPNRSRCSVIAKVHRLGLADRGMPENLVRRAPTAPEVKRDRHTGAIVQNIAARKPPKPGPQNRPAVAFGKVEVVNAAETEKRRTAHRAHGEKIIDGFTAPANDTAIPLMERRRFQCAWPVGEVSGAGQMCCGLPTDPDAPATTASYCPEHRARASAGIPKPARAPAHWRPAASRASGRVSASTLWDGARVA
jgi:GcrA cell cycle regulator